MDFTFWNRLRLIAWPLAAGMLAAVLVVRRFGADSVWLPFWAVVVVALIVSALAARTRPIQGEPMRLHGDDDLAALSPLARDILERLPDPLMLINASGRVILANRGMRGVIGVAPINRPVTALLRTPAVLDAIRQVSATGESASLEFSSPIPIQRNYLATVARTGAQPAMTILLLHDLTAMKRAEQMRADFVANASHELRTPLAALSGFIDTLKGHARDDLEAREQFLDIMTVEAERMRRLIDDLLSLTRIEQNEHVPPSGKAPLEIILKEAVATLTPLARTDNITLETAIEPDLPPAIGTRDELVQVFQNLIHNGIKYGRPGGHVWVDLRLGAVPGGRRAEQVLVASVRDDGEGIPSESIPRLTERFYRVDVKRSREKGGTGLGLAIVKHIVNRHHGRLTIESQAGKGSTFTVFLPAATSVSRAAVTEMS